MVRTSVTLLIALTAFTLCRVYAESEAGSDFVKTVEEAQREFNTDAGHDYAAEFGRTIAQSLSDAMQACHSAEFNSDAKGDVVFVISTQGRLLQIVPQPDSSYAKCVAAHLHLPDTLPQPPGGGWPVQIRVENGPRKTEGANTPFIVVYFGS